MGRLVRDFRMETREARNRLKPRHEPYWRLISEGIHIGYRKGERGGIWHLRVNHNGKYFKRSLGQADDVIDANQSTILNFAQAQDSARRIADKIHKGTSFAELRPYTIRNAIDEYLADFKASGKKSYYSTFAQINAHIIPTLATSWLATLLLSNLMTGKIH